MYNKSFNKNTLLQKNWSYTIFLTKLFLGLKLQNLSTKYVLKKNYLKIIKEINNFSIETFKCKKKTTFVVVRFYNYNKDKICYGNEKKRGTRFKKI